MVRLLYVSTPYIKKTEGAGVGSITFSTALFLNRKLIISLIVWTFKRSFNIFRKVY